jgi:UDP-glucose 4-epimerase
VSDTIRALKGLMEEPAASGEIFNVGSGNKISILELAERVRALTGSDSKLEFVPYDRVYGQGIEDMLHREPSVEKIRAATGWAPERDLAAILADVIAERSDVPAQESEQAATGSSSLALPARAR